MKGHAHDCPFLNKADSRCSGHFSLDRLSHAFRHCFGDYQGCGLYVELVAERRLRPRPLPMMSEKGVHDVPAPVVQVTVCRRIEKPLAGAA